MRNIFFNLCFLATLAATRCEDDAIKDSSLYNEDDFKESVPGKPHFIMFFAPWCGHCQRLRPVWSQLTDEINSDDEIDMKIAKVDCTEETKLCSDEGVVGYPTLKLYHPGRDPIRHKGSRDLESLRTFAIAAGQPQSDGESAVAHVDGLFDITDASFDAHTSKGYHFIMFYAPWCGHCKRLEPTWVELAKSHVPSEDNANDVRIGRVDCTAHSSICKTNEVRGYPTLLWFEDGKKMKKYQSGRDLESLERFVKETLSPASAEEEDAHQQAEQAQHDPDAMLPHKDGLFDITDESYDAHTSKGYHFIMFYAPWCGHCKRLEPTWVELAKSHVPSVDNANDPRIGRVDCTAHPSVCKTNEVRGYPTLLWLKDGKMIKKYQSGRDLESLEQFIKEMLGSVSAEEADAHQQADQPVPDAMPSHKDGLFDMTDASFDAHTSKGYHFIMFYAPWCGHCKRLEPTWVELAKSHVPSEDNVNDVRISRVDCTVHSSVCRTNQVRGYPTLLWFENGKMVKKYQSGRDLASLESFVKRTMDPSSQDADSEQEEQVAIPTPPTPQKKEEVEEKDSPVLVLKDENFDFHTAVDVTFVMFFAPWCGFCKRLAPVWEDLANEEFPGSTQVKIAKVDCTVYSDLCQKYEVKGYPTLLLFKDGEKISKFAGSRTKDDLKAFVLKEAAIQEEAKERVKEEL